MSETTLAEFTAQVASAASLAAAQESPMLPAATTPAAPIVPPVGGIAPPHEQTTMPAVHAPTLTLEEQAAAQDAAALAAGGAPVQPLPGSDIKLPASYGEAFAGKSLADVMGMLAAANQTITTQTEQLAAHARPPGVVPGAQIPPVPAVPGATQTPEQLAAAVAAGQQTPQQAITATLTEYANKFNAEGTLTAEDVAAIQAKTGLPTQMVIDHIQGEAAKAQLAAQDIYKITGGKEEGYNEMLKWMERHVPTAQLQEFNDSLATNNLGRIKFATEAMWGAYQASGGGAPTFFAGDAPAATRHQAFSGWGEVQAAMNDPRYATDESFRAAVEARLAVTNV